MTIRDYAEDLLTEFYMCHKARPRHNAVDLQLEKDACEQWAGNLGNQLAWGTDSDIAEAAYQLESRLKRLKEKIVFEVLKHGI
jgi:hypothetical protein